MAATLCRRAVLQYKNSIFKVPCRTGFLVLMPEVPGDTGQIEIFSKTGQMLDFEKITPKDCKHIMVRKSQMYDIGAWELSEEIKKKLENNEKIDVFKNVLVPLELVSIPFFSAWGLIETLYHANSTYMSPKDYKPLHDRAIQIRVDKFNLKPVYEACKQYLENNPDKCNEEERRVLQKFVWEGEMNGFEIKEEKKKEEFTRILETLEYRRKDYYNKWMNSYINFKEVIYSEEAAQDFPPDFLRYTAVDVEEPEKGPWIITLKPKIYPRFMEYCSLRQSRLHLWLSHRQLCSKHGDQRFRAEFEVEGIRNYKRFFAKTLGYPTYAHLAIKTKMAGSLDHVHDILEMMLEKAKIGQENEIYELDKFAKENKFMGRLELWDLDFWGRLHKQELYSFDERALQEYFPLSQVLLGLFALCEHLFGIVIQEDKNLKLWHTDVRCFRVIDKETKRDLGEFFFDPYARRTKRMSDECGGLFICMGVSSKVCGTLPSGSLIFDFAPPTEDKPSLLLFAEVEDLFYKFGLALQHILSDTQYSEVAGFWFLETDAAFVGAKFLKNWLYERGTLESISGHYNTGEPIPSHVLDGICKMKNYLAGTKLCTDIYRSLLDFQLNIEEEYCMPIVENLWPKHFLFDIVDVDHHPFGWKDMHLGASSCDKYVDIWSEMIAADIFKAFAEVGFRNHEEIASIGKRFRSTYFALAGGNPPKEVFKRFRGRDPSPLPYLDMLGLKDLESISPSTEPSNLITE